MAQHGLIDLAYQTTINTQATYSSPAPLADAYVNIHITVTADTNIICRSCLELELYSRKLSHMPAIQGNTAAWLRLPLTCLLSHDTYHKPVPKEHTP
jgi:hypothetical protein